ncbi:hypothetical protein KUCAC02_003039 [Chaenocephalus aceratus]|uniref:Uncharacterized protein n=1 Tax=Chaenocephalus aceratus TaxID=36190 RepID=A0ACB9WJF0_CHAAC|nr:hypothetical protein KUCAC02_003039 [Chaenocephalus aceratus]
MSVSSKTNVCVCVLCVCVCVGLLKWSDYCRPLACSPGQPFRAVAQASVDNFSRLEWLSLKTRLQLDKRAQAFQDNPELWEKQCPKTETFPHTGGGAAERRPPSDHQLLQCPKGSLLLPPEVKRRLEERRGSEPLRGSKDLGVACDQEDRSLGIISTWRATNTTSTCPAATSVWSWRTAPSSLSNTPQRRTFQTFLTMTQAGSGVEVRLWMMWSRWRIFWAE